MKSLALEDFTKRAEKAEAKLKSLEAQLNTLASHSQIGTSTTTSVNGKDEWKVVYWPLKNRGNFVKLVFAEAGVPFEDVSDMKVMKSMMRSTKYGKQTRDEGGPYQGMGPPFVINGDFFMSQCIASMDYLSRKFGICPKSLEDQGRAQMVMENCQDCFTELYKLQNSSKEEIFEYIEGRLQVWLDILEKPLQSQKRTFYFDGKCTQADLAMFNLLDGIEELFGDEMFAKHVTATHSYLVQCYRKLKERKGIKALMQKQKGLYCYAPHFGWKTARAIIRGQDEDEKNQMDVDTVTFATDAIIPDVVDSEPAEVLMVEYKLNGSTNGLFKMGDTLTPTQVQDEPNMIGFKGCKEGSLYTVILTDPDARDREKHEFREWIHFVKVNCTAKGSDLSGSGDVVIEYVGSGPPPGSGKHRYVWLVYEQKNGKIDVEKCGQKKLKSGGGGGEGRRKWKARAFVEHNKLGPLVAGTYYYAEYDDFVPKLYAWLQGKGSYKDMK